MAGLTRRRFQSEDVRLLDDVVDRDKPGHGGIGGVILARLHQLASIFPIFGASDGGKPLDLLG
jgi:hypothetical protein